MANNPNAINHSSTRLPTKPTANLNYTFSLGTPKTSTLVVFLNGLILSQSSWTPTILAIRDKPFDNGIQQPHLLAYDRYGQGTSDPDPEGTHEIMDVVSDLHSLLTFFCSEELNSTVSVLKVVLVCNSIGCAIARLYAAAHPTLVSGLIFLDSIMAHIDLMALWPDVDAPGFDTTTLSEETTVEEIRTVRQQYQRFHISAPNPENLDRTNLGHLLPSPESPVLQGNPLLTVVGHDPEAFAHENEVSITLPLSLRRKTDGAKKSFGVRKELVMRYIQPVWEEYNKGLVRLTRKEKVKGPIVARGCGHFIQRDDAEFVAGEICELLLRLEEIVIEGCMLEYITFTVL
jgi:pimeloyl-ACP methyl ester carboxylesterase